MWPTKKTQLPKLLETKAHLARSRSKLLSLYGRATERNEQRRMNYLNKKLQEAGRMVDSLREIETELLPQNSQGKRFVVSSLFLHECFFELTADPLEQFFFITGSESDGLLVLDQKCGFEHVSRTAAGVEGELKSTHALLCKLEHFGHRLLAHCHSHPGHGVGATLPSGIDRAFQERLERGGYPALAALFSRDGFIRFFRCDGDFELQIFGKGVEQVDGEPNIFHLTYLG